MANLRIIDTTLRDGSHAMSHQFKPEDMARVAAGLDEAGVDTIEMGHGDGLAGHSIQYGFAAASDIDYVKAVAGALKRAKLAVLLLPGIGTKKELEQAAKNGAKVARIATHVTEADIGEQHIRMAAELGMEPMGLLMMAHMVGVDIIAEQAKLMESYGASVLYLMDSAGAMTPQDVRERIAALKRLISIPIGFHAHNNLSLAIANTIAAVEAGASSVDGSLRGLGGGAGNAQIEVLVAVLQKLGHQTGVSLYKIMDAAQDILKPMLKRPIEIDNSALILGYAGVYSSFLLHAYRAAERFKVDPRDIIMELGRLKTVGGQEDLIIDVAAGLARGPKGGVASKV